MATRWLQTESTGVILGAFCGVFEAVPLGGVSQKKLHLRPSICGQTGRAGLTGTAGLSRKLPAWPRWSVKPASPVKPPFQLCRQFAAKSGRACQPGPACLAANAWQVPFLLDPLGVVSGRLQCQSHMFS